MGKSERSILLEMIVRPPISVEDEKRILQQWDIEKLEEILDIVIPEPEVEDDEENESDITEDDINEDEQEQETAQKQVKNLGNKLGMTFDAVGGLDAQLDTIVRRVLASRANPEATRRLGISHVKGILLSGPPGCGKTLLARELARLLGAREPQIVNGPEILDKFIGEAEKRVRDLFRPAELEYAQVGDDSALHIIILDEMDAIARKRGSASSDTTGVRDSVVNQLLAKMDGVKQANNVLVVGLTNRPELLDPALLRPGRLEVQLRVELPDAGGRRDIFRIHTRQMREAGGLSRAAEDMIEDLSDEGLANHSDKYTGAEIAGLVRSAASFALARSVQQLDSELDSEQNEDASFLDSEEGKVSIADFKQALKEVRPSLGKQDALLHMRFPKGISPCSRSMQRIMRDLQRFTAPVVSKAARLNSLLLVGAGGNGGAGVTALAAWAAAEASASDTADYVRFVTALDLLTGEGSGGEGSRAGALIDRFSEAREMPNSLLVLDDIDQLCAGSGPGGYSSIMIATLRALLRTPPESSANAKAGGQSVSRDERGRSMHIIATTSRSDAACVILHDLFEETIGKDPHTDMSFSSFIILFKCMLLMQSFLFYHHTYTLNVVVPLLTETDEISTLLSDAGYGESAHPMASLMVETMGSSGIGTKSVVRLGERAVATATQTRGLTGSDSEAEAEVETAIIVEALRDILEDFRGDEVMASSLCEVL
jgi:SpoVK/Ycf46/Vps4 family AAA+-type ATPase